MKRYFVFFGVLFAVIAFAGCGNTETNTATNSSDVDVEEVENFSAISGTISFTGLKPDVGEEGEITISARVHGQGDVFEPVDLAVEPKLVDNAVWTWDSAITGNVYDLQASLVVGGKKVATSNIQTATAPASNVDLSLQVTWSNLPTEGREKSFQKIGGDIIVNGYVPSGATVTIYTAKARDNSELEPEEVDNPQFTAAVKNVAVNNDKKWYWDEALGQIDYLVKSEIYNSGGTLIGTSDIVRATAPNENVTMHITSKAEAPVQEVTISGTTQLDGSYKKDSEIVVSVRKGGEGGFDEVARFPAESSREWKYTKATNGVEYDVRAALVQKGDEIAKSSQKHTVAPAKNIKLKIDTGMTLSDPTEKPYLVECKKKDSKKYDAKITFPGIGDARAYWVKAGTSKHSGNRFNEAERPDSTGKDLTIKMRVDKDKDYYVEYAYSYCKDCETLDSFSDFSPHMKFSCPE
jgi:hypothetical protein